MNYVLGKGIQLSSHELWYEFCWWGQQLDTTGGKDDKYMLSGCELIDTENISLPRQNMKFGAETS
jgi:hypothetical protein